jgi:hypothetical protein
MFPENESFVCAAMHDEEEQIVYVLGQDVLLLRTEETIQVASLKHHEEEKLEYFKRGSFFTRSFARQCPGILPDVCIMQQFADLHLPDCCDETSVEFNLSIPIFGALLYHAGDGSLLVLLGF